jgi:hypothetical protein
MAYTRAWSTAIPANTDPASGAPSDMSAIRVDLQERMDTLLGTGEWAKDPVGILMNDLFMMFHWSDFMALSGSVAAWTAAVASLYGANYGSANTVAFYCPLILPRGVEITDIEVLGQTGASSSLTLTLEVVDATSGTPTQTTLATATMAAGTTQSAKSSGAVSVTIDSTVTNYKFYYLKLIYVWGSSSTWFQGAKVTYNRSSIAQTL